MCFVTWTLPEATPASMRGVVRRVMTCIFLTSGFASAALRMPSPAVPLAPNMAIAYRLAGGAAAAGAVLS
ncbi:MAG: hypothetical protein WBN06_12120 [Lysobacterales bacterium]